ncbi:MAG: anaerobic ribonucleoside-triphosphate reductase activating protein [Spirochaetaceae bacterium]|jgi:pyruvate formate lyase activating enzyme|nr:anaerobic ribonucleoside-triphosphate reductase activating protein [Spirochaetaceae bacterium]
MRLSFRKTSLVDFPGKIAACLFFPGCNLRCPWCYNRGLVLGEEPALVPLGDVVRHLAKRRAVLGGVVLSGGEPLVYELGNLIRRIKDLGLSVKIDTNGMAPASLEAILQDRETQPDYIALDLKMAPRRYYGVLTGRGDPASALPASAALVRVSGIPHEFRTLAFPDGFVAPEDVAALSALVDDAPWYFRAFRPGNCLDPAWDAREPASAGDAEALARFARSLGKQGIASSEGGIP